MKQNLVLLRGAVMLVLHLPMVAAPRFAAAQNPGAAAGTDLTKLLQFSVPNSPAMKLIGATAEKITRPGSLKELATSLLSGVDAQGRFQQGVAIEVSPIQLVNQTMDRAWYQKNLFLANLGVSIATTKASGDSSSTNLSLGVRSVIVDRANPVASREYENQAVEALRACVTKHGGTGPIAADSIPRVRACVTAADTAIGHKFRRDHWNDYVVTVGGAYGLSLVNSEWDGSDNLGGQVWATVAGPICLSAHNPSRFCRRGQWLLEGQYESRDSTTISPQSLSQLMLGARVTWGSEVFGLFAEYLSLHRRDPAPQLKERVSERSAGIEFRVSDELWASTGLGSRYNDMIGKSQMVVVANLRINLTSNRKIVTSPTI